MTPETFTALLEAAAAAVAIARLASLRLAGMFPALVSFLAVIGASAVAGAVLSPASRAYFWLYAIQTPIYCALALLAARELFSVVFRRYPGIQTAGKTAVYSCAAGACIISIVFAIAHWGPKVFFTRLVYIELARRSIVLSAAVFVLLILYTLSRYPLQLGRNVRISGVLFSALFLSQSAELLFDSFSVNLYNRLADVISVAFGAACTLVWAALLRPEPAAAPVVVKFSSEQEENLIHQLDSLNRLLTRAARQ